MNVGFGRLGGKVAINMISRGTCPTLKYEYETFHHCTRYSSRKFYFFGSILGEPEIKVCMSSSPTKDIAMTTHPCRPAYEPIYLFTLT